MFVLNNQVWITLKNNNNLKFVNMNGIISNQDSIEYNQMTNIFGNKNFPLVYFLYFSKENSYLK